LKKREELAKKEREGELGFFLFGGLWAGAPANAPQTEEDKRSQAAHPIIHLLKKK